FGPIEKWGTGGVGVAGGVVKLIFEVEVNAEGELVEAIDANDSIALLPCSVVDRNHHREEESDDGDDDEDFNEGEGVCAGPRVHTTNQEYLIATPLVIATSRRVVIPGEICSSVIHFGVSDMAIDKREHVLGVVESGSVFEKSAFGVMPRVRSEGR